ncbi:MarR family winged helix-turn-helix transcriptional regulator [Caulobacter henricii]|uniref:MarR family transcriptional regulator n=1 Tax=Caulobacter henricii TaxID=69395 RepID=A0A0N7JHS5_9CAUL|nr:MarR family transcriptional regulator [Caulobacter henricii]ALL14210.1 MarR family transcriptional regulator [Caulobacter henricii]
MSQSPKSGPEDAAVQAPVEALRLDRQLCFALYGAANRITRLYRPLLEALGLTYPQYLVMLALWEHNPLTVGALGQALDLDSSTLTPLLKRLETARLIARSRDPQDERRVIITLTSEGQDLREAARAIPAQILCRIDLPLETLAALRDRLKTLAT